MGGERRHRHVSSDGHKLDPLEVISHLVGAVPQVVAAVAGAELSPIVATEAPAVVVVGVTC